MAAAIVALASLGGAATARAEGARVAIVGVRNDPGGAVAEELARAVCGKVECVPREKVTAGARLDFAAARREGVDGLLFGTVQTAGGSRSLALALLRDSMKPERAWRLPLDARGRFTPGPVAALQRELAALRGAAAPAPAPAVVERATPVREPAADPEPAEPRRAAVRGAAVAAGPTRTSASRPVPGRTAPASSEPSAQRPGLAAADVGMWALQRRLQFQGVRAAGGTLRDFSGGTLVSPALRAEVFPLASAEAWYAGFGAFAGYARSVGFRTEEAPAGTKHDTVFSALDAGLAFRSPRLGSSGLLLVPSVSWRSLSFAASGGGIPGLPDAKLGGVAVGIAAELPLGRRFAALADVGYVAWTSAGDLVGDEYFKSGSAYGLEGSLGLEAALSGPVALRLAGVFSQTSYSLTPGATYSATGATDRYVGGRVALRARF